MTSEFDDFDEFVELFENTLGPMVTARNLLEPEGRWTDAREDVLAIYKGANERELPAIRTSAEYLLTGAGARLERHRRSVRHATLGRELADRYRRCPPRPPLTHKTLSHLAAGTASPCHQRSDD